MLLSQIRNFSQVAEKLNISQPALSKQILSLEKELGVKLFDRNSSPVSVTAAGEHFVRQAQELLYREDQLHRSMEQFQSGEAGQLVIGITPFRSSYLMAPVIQKVNARFPGIRVQLHEHGSEILRKEAAEGKYDFAVVNLPVDDSLLEVIALEPDRLALAVPKALAHTLPQTGEIEFTQCRDLPFVVVGQTQEMRRLFDKLCVTAGFTPRIAVEVVGLNTAWAMARAGVAATILPLQFVNRESPEEALTVIPIKDAVYTRQPVVVTRRDQYRTEAAQYAIDLLTGQQDL